METKDKIYDFISIGGGAAGFFGAINVQKLSSKDLKVAIVESSSSYLRKVKISGGGRCNVTNACTNPKELIQNYPRGGRNLLNSFYSFGTEDMVSWLSENGVATHTEADGRMFPRSNKSETIIKCFIKLCEKHRVEILGSTPILSITKEESFFLLKSKDSSLKSKQILIATGSSAKGHSL
ncbi:MAG: NAD(P)/FAD-dependent oxidoreductase, partial [Bacteriovoracaceae bacterium]